MTSSFDLPSPKLKGDALKLFAWFSPAKIIRSKRFGYDFGFGVQIQEFYGQVFT